MVRVILIITIKLAQKNRINRKNGANQAGNETNDQCF